MGKRFGRGQKQKMRQQIEDLSFDALRFELAAKRRGDEIRFLAAENNKWRQAFHFARQVLGQHCAALPLETACFRNRSGCVSVARPGNAEARADFTLISSPDNMCEMIELVATNRAEFTFDEITGAVALIIETPGDLVAYAVSDRALKLMPVQPFVRNALMAMEPMLVAQLSKIAARKTR